MMGLLKIFTISTLSIVSIDSFRLHKPYHFGLSTPLNNNDLIMSNCKTTNGLILGLLLTFGVSILPVNAATTSNININQISNEVINSKRITSSIIMSGLFDSTEQNAVNDVSSFQKPIAELLDQLKPSYIPNPIGVYSQTQVLKSTKEDADVVLVYLETYIKPCQKKMEEGVKLISPKLDPSVQERFQLLPLLMKGHIAELNQAINEIKVESEGKEVQEVQETLAEYLKIASSKFDVVPYAPPRPLSDSELFGPLGCQFWGKTRVEGSNACAPSN
eukprot:gene4457-6303_t